MSLTLRQQNRKIWLEQAIENIEQAMLGNLKRGRSSLTFNGRAVTNMNPMELEELRRKFELELQSLEKQENANGIKTRTVRVIG